MLLTLGARAFMPATPKLWSSLPRELSHIQSFSVFKRTVVITNYCSYLIVITNYSLTVTLQCHVKGICLCQFKYQLWAELDHEATCLDYLPEKYM